MQCNLIAPPRCHFLYLRFSTIMSSISLWNLFPQRPSDLEMFELEKRQLDIIEKCILFSLKWKTPRVKRNRAQSRRRIISYSYPVDYILCLVKKFSLLVEMLTVTLHNGVLGFLYYRSLFCQLFRLHGTSPVESARYQFM